MKTVFSVRFKKRGDTMYLGAALTVDGWHFPAVGTEVALGSGETTQVGSVRIDPATRIVFVRLNPMNFEREIPEVFLEDLRLAEWIVE